MAESAIHRQANEAQARAGDREDLARLTQPMPLLDTWPTRAGVIALGVIAGMCVLALLVVALELPIAGDGSTGAGAEEEAAPTAPGEEVVVASTASQTIGGLRLIASLLGMLTGTVIGALAGVMVVARLSPTSAVRQDIGERSRGQDETPT